jgi:hypothetical protein
VGHGRIALDLGADVLADLLVAGLRLGGRAREIDLRHQGGVAQLRLRHTHRARLCRTTPRLM